LPRKRVGRLAVADSGTGDVVLLLHGLGATGDYFGSLYADLCRNHRLLIPDLLGFGRSLDDQCDDFSPTAHVDALDETLDALGLRTASVTVAAHSMGSAVALLWAQRHPERTNGVVLFAPPAYCSATAARRAVGAAGPMARLFLLDTDWAHALCRLSCSNRTLAGIAMAVASPCLPVSVTRQASLHTWDAYRQSISGLVLDADWSSLLSINVPLTIVRGLHDHIGDRRYLVEVSPQATFEEIEDADHHLAITHSHIGRRIVDAVGNPWLSAR
jgi:pimeloyl-ACP methyl ester carboxylesterase